MLWTTVNPVSSRSASSASSVGKSLPSGSGPGSGPRATNTSRPRSPSGRSTRRSSRSDRRSLRPRDGAQHAEALHRVEGAGGQRQCLRGRDDGGQPEQPSTGGRGAGHRLDAHRLRAEVVGEPGRRAADPGADVDDPGVRPDQQRLGEPGQVRRAAAAPAPRGDGVLGAELPHGVLGPAREQVELDLLGVGLLGSTHRESVPTSGPGTPRSARSARPGPTRPTRPTPPDPPG